MERLLRPRVSENRRFLMTEDGKPFFWQGDTAWELFHRLSLEEAEVYLEKRRQQGFNVIQAVALAEIDGLHTPNANGDIPLFDDDPTRPNEAYFRHVDAIVRLAHRKGIYIGLLPTWGDKVRPAWAKNSNNIFNLENARVYGRFLGERYRDDSNIIWILGGDRDAEGLQELWGNMAAGIVEGQGQHTLTTFHPIGGHTSSKWFPDTDWLDHHMIQSGHHKYDIPNWEMIEHDYALTPTKPVLDGEPNYEDHPINWNAENGYFTDYDVRKQLYRSLFAGSFGHTYGHQSVWQMYDEGREPVAFPLFPWRVAIDRPGAWQVRHAKNLLLALPFFTRIPDQSLLVSANEDGAKHVQATRDSEGRYALVYIPMASQEVAIDLSKLASPTLKLAWFDPRTAALAPIGERSNSCIETVTTPVEGPDWVLVIRSPEVTL